MRSCRSLEHTSVVLAVWSMQEMDQQAVPASALAPASNATRSPPTAAQNAASQQAPAPAARATKARSGSAFSFGRALSGAAGSSRARPLHSTQPASTARVPASAPPSGGLSAPAAAGSEHAPVPSAAGSTVGPNAGAPIDRPRGLPLPGAPPTGAGPQAARMSPDNPRVVVLATAQAAKPEDTLVHGRLYLKGTPAEPFKHSVNDTPSLDAATQVLLDEHIRYLMPKRNYLSTMTPETGPQLQRQLSELQQQGRVYDAYAVLIELSTFMIFRYGPDHPDTFDAVHQVVDNMYQRGKTFPEADIWLLQRLPQHWGYNSPKARQLVQRAAVCLTKFPDPAPHRAFARAVTHAVLQLPGGLGWGIAEVPTHAGVPYEAGVPDVEAYNRHVVMETQAGQLVKTEQFPAAHDLFKRCVGYYESMGSNWLARKVACMVSRGMCVSRTDGPVAAMGIMRDAMRVAQRELGMKHVATLDATWHYAQNLRAMRQLDTAHSLMRKTLERQHEVYGPLHSRCLANEVRLSQHKHHAPSNQHMHACFLA